MKGYKLTNTGGRTRNAMQWGEGVTHKATGEGCLCGPGWLHYYSDCKELAVVLAPLHSVDHYSRMWECTAKGKIKNDKGLKYGCTKLTTVREIPMPEVSVTQRVDFIVLCALEVCEEPGWRRWAKNWLSGCDRSEKTAKAVEDEVANRGGAENSLASNVAAWAAWEAQAIKTQLSKASKVRLGLAVAEITSWALGINSNLNLKELIRKAIKK